jgi:Flp pilus assembly protein TadG
MKNFKLFQRGVAAVEFALTMFVLLLIGAGLAEFGRAIWYYDAIVRGTRDAARQLSSVPTSGLAAATAATAAVVVDTATAGGVPDFSSANVTVTCAPAACAAATLPADVTRVTVSASYPLQLGALFPFIVSQKSGSNWSVTLAPHTTMPTMW